MITSPLDSPLLAPLVSDSATAAMFSEEDMVATMLGFEGALASVQERLGLIPAGMAKKIETAVFSMEVDLDRLGEETASVGHPVAELVSQLRAQAGAAGEFVHYGATAQDVIDTALVLRLAVATILMDERLRALIGSLSEKADKYRDCVMAGRTRSQHAVPITFGLKIAGWLVALVRHRERLFELQPRVLTVQFGGAAGTLGVLGTRGLEVMEGLALELDLAAPPTPWHSQRDGLAEMAGWFSLVTGTLGKMGQDLVLLSQSEAGEVIEGSGGGSSAMPHKSNPVRSEALVAIARANASLLSSMHQAAVHDHERSGSAWTLEWLTLPQMAILAGASVRIGLEVAESLEGVPERMLRNIEGSHGTLMSEAAMVALADKMPLAKARKVVADASLRARKSGENLIAILRRERAEEVDWLALEDPRRWLGSATDFVDQAIEDAKADR